MLLIKPQARDIGFPVRRILPSAQRWMVGPFIFLDHMGPATFPEGTREGDVRPHPHIGLATVTWLYSGAFMHRDSLAVVQRIEPGAVNLMVAGRGVVHSERIPEDIRSRGAAVEGIQMWLALPAAEEDGEPRFAHHDGLPEVSGPGWRLRVVLGSYGEAISPVSLPMAAECFDLVLEPGAQLRLSPGVGERALYLAQGDLAVQSEPLPRHHLLVPEDPQQPLQLTSAEGARVMVIGGAAYPEPRHVVWNFVSSRPEAIERAKAEWAARRFPPVPGETEFIPLPG